ncbi:hypothetical protein CJO93_14685 [Ralstonia solanacearum]|nr:hypothetical protein CJO93_14685 [Ralstonia solanacearum]
MVASGTFSTARSMPANARIAMLKDMLTPPIGAQEESVEFLDQAKASAERAASSVDEAMEPTEAYEERNAAKEAEAMKRPRE